MRKKFVLAVITARAGSKRIKGKNLRTLAGKPLIAHTIRAALNAKGIDKVIVSTDSERIAKISRKFGADVPFMRPKELSGDKANSFDAIRHAIKEFEKIYGKKVSHIVLLQPTSPFREARHIDKALEKFFESKANSLFSVVKAKDGNKFLVYLKKGKLCFGKGQGKLFALNGAIYIYDKPTIFANEEYAIGKKSVLFKMLPKESIDIDTEEDFKKAEKIAKK